MEFYSLDPWDERRADLREATNAAVLVNELRGVDNTIRVIANGLGAKAKIRHDVLHPRDLMPIFDPDERKREEKNRNDTGEQEKQRAKAYAEKFHRERREVKLLLGLSGTNPNAMEPVIAEWPDEVSKASKTTAT